MGDKLLSVIVPVYNAEPYIASALDSVLGQTFTDFELLVMDDGSDDRSPEIVRGYEQKDSRVRFFPRENRGVASTLNELIDLSSGTHIARMDADDICYPRRLEKQLGWLEKHQLNIVGSGINRVSEAGNKPKNYPAGNAAIKASTLVWGEPFAHPTVLAERDMFFRYRYRQNFTGIEDFHLWLQMAQDPEIKMGNVPEVLLDYRKHDSQATRSRGKAWYDKKRVEAMFEALNLDKDGMGIDSVKNFYDVVKRGAGLHRNTTAKFMAYVEMILSAEKFDRETRSEFRKKVTRSLLTKPAVFEIILAIRLARLKLV
jgi:glycosyltransferase involved in cell wall biosynthesis